MFYAAQLVSRDGPLQVLWVAATLDRQLNRQLVDGTAIAKVVDVYLKPESNIGIFSAGPVNQAVGQHRKAKGGRGHSQPGAGDTSGDAAPLALRLSGQLLLGVCRIYSRKVVYLLQDCERALLFLRNICPEDVPLAFGDEREAGWGEGDQVILAGSQDHGVAEGEGRKPKSRKRITAAGLAAADSDGGMAADGLAPLVLPYDEDEILLAGSSQSCRVSDAKEAGGGGGDGVGPLLGRLGSGFGSGALDEYLVGWAKPKPPAHNVHKAVHTPRANGDGHDRMHVLCVQGTPGAGGSQDPWAVPWASEGGLSGRTTDLGLGTPGGVHLDYFDEVPEHFEFDLDEEELEGLRIASQIGVVAQQRRVDKAEEQLTRELQDDGLWTPRRGDQERREAQLDEAPGADTAVTEPRQVLPQFSGDNDEQQPQGEPAGHEAAEAAALSGRMVRVSAAEAGASAEEGARALAKAMESAEFDGWGQSDPDAGSATALSLGPGSGEDMPGMHNGSKRATEIEERMTEDRAGAPSTLPAAAAEPQTPERPATGNHNRKVTLSPVAVDAAAVAASPRPQPRSPSLSRAASSPLARVTLDVAQAGSTSAKGDGPRPVTTLPTAAVRNLLQDRTGLINYERLNAARRRVGGTYAAATPMCLAHVGDMAQSFATAASSPWFTAWSHAAGPEAARGLHGTETPVAGAGSSGVATTVAKSSSNSRGGNSHLPLLNLAAGPVAMPLVALAPPLQELFSFLSRRGGQDRVASADKDSDTEGAGEAPPTKRARKSKADAAKAAAVAAEWQQPLDGAETGGGSSGAGAGASGAGANAPEPGRASPPAQLFDGEEAMPHMDLDLELGADLNAAGPVGDAKGAGEQAAPQEQPPHTGYQLLEEDEMREEEEAVQMDEEEECDAEELEMDGIQEDEGTSGQKPGHVRKAASDGFTARTQVVLRHLQALAAGARSGAQPASKCSQVKEGRHRNHDGQLQLTTASKLLSMVARVADPSAAAGRHHCSTGTSTSQLCTSEAPGSSSGPDQGDGGSGVSRMAAARTFYDLLVLTNRGYISLAWAGGEGMAAGSVARRNTKGGRGWTNEGSVAVSHATASSMGGAEELIVIARKRLQELQPATNAGTSSQVAASC